MSNTISNNSEANYPKEYLKGIKDTTLPRMDEAGNGDGKVTVDEA